MMEYICKEKPLVSVVIPTYKRPDMIVRAVESVCRQSYSNIEIIIVDDNGKGTQAQLETERAIHQFKNKVLYIAHEANKNGSAARNTGWRISHGEYITFLDDDDEIDTRRIQKQVEKMESLDESWGACYTAYHILKKNGKEQKSFCKKDGNVYIQALMRTLYVGSGSNLLLRKIAVDDVGGYDELFVRNQDIEFMARIFEKYKLAYVDEDLLTIHLEVRQFNRSFEFNDEISQFYLEKFNDKIEKLSSEERKRIKNVIALERARVALISYRKYDIALKILIENRVSLMVIVRYVIYMTHRKIKNKSYGFYL